jgi:hypothetical protein
MSERKRSKLRRLLLQKEPETKMQQAYKPRTEFLKRKLAEAHFDNRKERAYIEELCRIEDSAYRRQVLRIGPGFAGSYSFIHPEQFGPCRNEYFAMLKELSQPDYIRVLANEMADPKGMGGWKNGKQIPLPSGLSKEDKKAVLERKERLDAERAEEWRIADARQKAKEKKDNKRGRRWWVKNGGKL